MPLDTCEASTDRRVYLDYTQEALDRAYTQSAWAPNMQALLDDWSERSTACRTPAFGYGEHAYGLSGDERIDVYDAPGRMVHFHIHGGAWRRQSKAACGFIAAAMRDLSVPFVVPEFGKLPQVRMPDVLDQIARALAWTHERFVRSGAADGIVVSGHSSGAHMAALLAAYDFAGKVPTTALRAVLCISGAYDLAPVMLSSRGSYIDLTEGERRRLSPIHRVADTRVPIHLVFGARESPEFRRQSRAYAAALAAGGRLASCTEIAGANHFEVADQLGTPGTPVGDALAGLLTMPFRPRDMAPDTAADPRIRAAT